MLKTKNNAAGTLASGITNSQTSLTLTATHGARFPTLGASDYFYSTLADPSNNLEVVKVTARAGDVLTVVRGQDGTTGLAYSAGDRFELRPCNAMLEALDQEAIDAVIASGTDTYTGNLDPVPNGYNTDQIYFVKFPNANTVAAPTLNLNSYGAKTIKRIGGAALVSGNIKANMIGMLLYDGTDMILLNPIDLPDNATNDYILQADADSPNGMAWVPPFLGGTSRLSRISNTELSLGVGLIPLKVGNRWVTRRITAAVTKDNTGLAVNTLYYVYAVNSAGTTVLEFSTTAFTQDTTFGVQTKTGDATRTLVGRVRTNASSQFPAIYIIDGVRSWFRPAQYIRYDVSFYGPDSYGASQADTGGAFVSLGNALSSSAFANVPWPGLARVVDAKYRAIISGSNTGNGVRLLHADDGPTNEVGIVDIFADGGGNPQNLSANVTTEIQALQSQQTVHKNLITQVAKVNGSTMTIFALRLELLLELTDSF
jgi:hypothetical protein